MNPYQPSRILTELGSLEFHFFEEEFGAMAAKAWIDLVVLLTCSAMLTEAEGGCSNGGSCSTDRADTSDDLTYRLYQHQRPVAAVDVVVVTSVARDSHEYHLWLQVAIPSLDIQLKNLGMGTTAAMPNRYAVLQFDGDLGAPATRFVRVDDAIFFPLVDFVHARRQLVRNGRVADGYQAIDFALRHAPFRTVSDVGKMVFFVGNVERVPLDASITKATVQSLLRERGVFFGAVVAANMSVVQETASEPPHQVPVIGLTSHNQGVNTKVGFSYATVAGPSIVASEEAGLVRDYVNMTLDYGSAVGDLRILALHDDTVIQSFIGAMVVQSGIQSGVREEVCQQCRCEGLREEEVVDEEGGEREVVCLATVCEAATDQELCNCLVQRSPAECSVAITPSPVSVSSTISGPLQTPIILNVEGSITVRPSGDVAVDFTSNKNRAVYDCILLDGTTLTPPIQRCTSPFQMKALVEGQHSILVIAKRKGFYGTRKFDFDIAPVEVPESELTVTLTEQPEFANGSILVKMDVRKGSIAPTSFRLRCSTRGRDFVPCASPYFVNMEGIGREGLDLVVVAIDDRNSVALATKHLIQQIIHEGPVQISIEHVTIPDPLGRLQILFSTSRLDARCICRTNVSNPACNGVFELDPVELGGGLHSVSIVCMDTEGYSTTTRLKVQLSRPPPSNPAPLSCNMTLTGPTPQGTVLAVYRCDRRVFSTCQVSGRPAVACNFPYGLHEIDIRNLSSGPHLFILRVQDVDKKSLMKLQEFTVGTAHRKCCPVINSGASSLTMHSPSYALLDLQVGAGNCTETEGFSYDINWGDGSSEMGLSHSLQPVAVSKVYNTTTTTGPTPTGEGQRLAVEVTYCNNPVLQGHRCCDTATFARNL